MDMHGFTLVPDISDHQIRGPYEGGGYIDPHAEGGQYRDFQELPSVIPPSRGIAILGVWVDTSGVGVGVTARRPPRCAGWARNPKGPQGTPFCN